ncbi:MAG: hypothetical protein KKA62_04810 [Nanoarchaeota archaeon]|nr:hypothetical protein [Nanoarchaeota archaeon]MBU1644238.1 hypothetical protein [Nanoarchaeota archaeon]MBU1977242.1 hypothetical protein [Nanoarchaeota archaeon]
MEKKRRSELLNKGWEESEIKRAEAILEKEEHHDVFFSKMVFWSAALVIIFANLLISLILIPFIVVFDNLFLYIIVVLLAATVGFLYNFLITDIGHLEKKHHIIAGIITPLLALGNMIVMVLVSNRFIEKSNVIKNQPHNPYLLAVFFGVAFILPYLIDRLRKFLRNK